MADQLSQEEIEECKASFDQFDRDGNGTIDAKELGGVMRSLNMVVNDTEVKSMIRELDADGSGSIDFNEFLSIFNRSKENKADIQKELMETFKVFDKDNDGTISASELREVMNSLGENTSEDELERMLEEADLNQDGVINYEEFVKMLGP
ncbi:calmodulin [Zychaea mexicana]|uniref:calmodulin n=1 Tax=Zychaea mexicana TaxID=64656 RepID=UPI0022FEA1DE|nr:calmodulin [Zychaea mexicana]KAI9489368.1 calmodulin [Zychaea mexicana]